MSRRARRRLAFKAELGHQRFLSSLTVVDLLKVSNAARVLPYLMVCSLQTKLRVPGVVVSRSWIGLRPLRFYSFSVWSSPNHLANFGGLPEHDAAIRWVLRKNLPCWTAIMGPVGYSSRSVSKTGNYWADQILATTTSDGELALVDPLVVRYADELD